MPAEKLATGDSPNWNRYKRLRTVASSLEKAIFWGYRMVAKHTIDPARHSVSITEATYSPWNVDTQFNNVYELVRDHTLVDKRKCFSLWHYSHQLAPLSGDILEVGVWRGGTGCLLAKSLVQQNQNGTVYLCDTFEGMPPTDAHYDNLYRGGELADTSFEHVKALARTMELGNVKLCKGIFPKETEALVPSNRFKLVHVDVDIFTSARDTVEWVWDKLVPGGLIIFDDYGYSATEGVTKYVDQHLSNRSDALFIYNLCGHGIVVKR